MLSKEDNDLLTRVGPGTLMGTMLRQYWIPVLFSSEVMADGTPERLRIMGEDLLAFRASDGRVGILAENCPHRGASLYFGRNEESGLRCIYHGWKFDTEGHCVDMPNEPPESNFADKVRIKAYPCIEKAGTIWTYMGMERPAPPLPALEWLDLPESHSRGSKRVQYSNWVQAMEGDIDQSHLSFTHSSLRVPEVSPGERPTVQQVAAFDKHPRFEVVDQPCGYTVGATRSTPDPDVSYTRITQWLMPFHTMTGVTGFNPVRGWRAWVPIDDFNTVVIGISFHPLTPLAELNRDGGAGGGQGARPGGTRGGVANISDDMKEPKTSKPFGAWRPLPTIENDFFQDRALQKNETFTGIREFWAQDAAPQLSMGFIFQRQYEHLGTTDRAIIQARRHLLNAAKTLSSDGASPPGVWNPEWYQVRSGGKFHGADEWWFAATEQDRKAIAGTNPDCSV